MLSMLETMHEDWQLPIWITEFACPPYQDCSADDNLKFMEAIVPQLDALDYVYRYSWSYHNPPLLSSCFSAIATRPVFLIPCMRSSRQCRLS
mmetsp:Transcript_35255/g.59452  ORF Transcript_35255/g.59452 Transcript_35255/m.59452 type:complete len:92 (+) Transcript_35255:364-639(+)